MYKQFFGKSIIQYAQEVRLKVARERMLYTQTPLEVIAETSGFPSYTYFYRVFKKAFGVSPKQYRSSNGSYLE
ncbi:helix-turn-helix domain-containing protein [Paenibacillus sp.]|uniref:helix-turn-helix domain-containing protein n=1 Tax=Paenibacillus sp. TaxID=58172 RepID=UPI0039C9508A